jgi:hypothetical protein
MRGDSVAAKLVRLSVTGATGLDEKNWAAVKSGSGSVTIEATTAPRNVADEWKQLVWSGDKGEAAGLTNRRKFSLATSKVLHLEVSLGGVSKTVDIWVLWATLDILTKGSRPAGAAPFDPGSRDDSDTLGAVEYVSLSSSVIDEKAGIFVDNMGASGKVAVVAALSPKGVNAVASAGWTIERQVDSRDWIDGVAGGRTTKSWTADTSKPTYLRLKPDNGDKIYDVDAPDLRWGQESSETYNNFRQWVTWNGARCSDYATWFWQARWHLNRDATKQITLNEVQPAKNLKLPSKPFYPRARRP